MTDTARIAHPRLDEILAELESARRDLLETIRQVPAHLLDESPRKNAWSIPQVLEHLAIVENGAGRLVNRLIREAREHGALETEESSLLNSLDHVGVAIPTRRIAAPDFVSPREGLTAEQSLQRLDESRQKLLQVVEQARGLALGTASAPHPVAGPLDVYQWLLITAQHERRHIHQIRELSRSENAA